jgi:hypothetical protein
VTLFKTFFDANTAREFLQNGSNFKDSERFNFQVRWFKPEDEFILSDSLKSKIMKYCNRQNVNVNMNFNNGFMGMNNWNNDFNKPMMNQNVNPMGVNPMMNGMQMQNIPMNMQYQMQMQNMQNFPMNNMQMNNQQQNMQFNNMNGMNNLTNNFNKNSGNEDEKKSNMHNGKYTCRFEIQIENDKDFQVARRLIGSKVLVNKLGM